ncbi:MAG: nitrate reductase molybdenum cofactor assembly chaperone [Burkholderiales bacterium]
MKTLKALGALLGYPSRDLIDALPEIHGVVVEEGAISRKTRDALRGWLKQLETTDLLDLEEAYVATFDRGRATSLHLFEHVHGDSRDRGPAMVDLGNVYANAGYHLSARELPDYLPVLLEFLSGRPAAEMRAMLADCEHILRSLGEALAKRGSGYAIAIGAILEAAGLPRLKHVPIVPEVEDQAALDEAWAEAPAFGPGSPSHPTGTTGTGGTPPNPAISSSTRMRAA